MKWINEKNKLPIKSWCENVEESAMSQAENLANHPKIYRHVAIMPDCHTGYGMPIGGVIACLDAVIPNAVGVDIGCGMGAVETNIPANSFRGKKEVRKILDRIKELVPVGEGHARQQPREWDGFSEYLGKLGISGEFNKEQAIDDGIELPGWLSSHCWKLAGKNLGTLGGGNHFIEIQKDGKGKIWLMLHSGSRNLGYNIARYHHDIAKRQMVAKGIVLADEDLAFLDGNSTEGKNYIDDMNFALSYAAENRRIMMEAFKKGFSEEFPKAEWLNEINIHHNYASLETHFDKEVWVHRKGATSAKKDEYGIIPGSMGTSSYIVRGLGNSESFCSCSHGAGRVMSRMKACRELTLDDCEAAMGNVVHDRWHKLKGKFNRKNQNGKLYDFGESPLAYKNIDLVIEAEKDLIEPLVKLEPIGVVKG